MLFLIFVKAIPSDEPAVVVGEAGMLTVALIALLSAVCKPLAVLCAEDKSKMSCPDSLEGNRNCLRLLVGFSDDPLPFFMVVTSEFFSVLCRVVLVLLKPGLEFNIPNDAMPAVDGFDLFEIFGTTELKGGDFTAVGTTIFNFGNGKGGPINGEVFLALKLIPEEFVGDVALVKCCSCFLTAEHVVNTCVLLLGPTLLPHFMEHGKDLTPEVEEPTENEHLGLYDAESGEYSGISNVALAVDEVGVGGISTLVTCRLLP